MNDKSAFIKFPEKARSKIEAACAELTIRGLNDEFQF